jgi:hydroxymethylbilane synthase
MAQSGIVAGQLRTLAPDAKIEIVPIVTSGDRHVGALAPVGGKGLFTKELEEALRRREIDLAVHSAKDLAAQMPDDLTLAAIPRREDPRDAIISRFRGGLKTLPAHATVGTASLRRKSQLLALCPDANIVPVRGNIETRLAKLFENRGRENWGRSPISGEGRSQTENRADSPISKGDRQRGHEGNRGASPIFDAIILAVAGLNRLSGQVAQYADYICPLPVEQFVPAAGQGALAIQTRCGDAALCGLLARINDPDSCEAVMAERSVLEKVGAGCTSSIGVHIGRPACQTQCWHGWAMASRADGSDLVRVEFVNDSVEALETLLSAALVDAGADKFFK